MMKKVFIGSCMLVMLVLLTVVGCKGTGPKKGPTSKADALAPAITPKEARAIAREAYIYGFPFVEGYKTLYKQAIDTGGPDFKATFNQIGHAKGVATPDDKQFVTPNTDTPYSFLWADLRAEPIVITMPKIEKTRYYTGQMVDLYTHNFGYLGTRVSGNSGGNFLVAGPGWKGKKPDGIRAVIRRETELFYVLFRIQLLNASDLDNVKAIQAGMKAQPLSQFLGKPAPKAVPAVTWPKPVEGMTETPAIFGYLNFLLQFTPTHASEKQLMARFGKLGIGASRPFDFAKFSPELQKAIKDGIADVWQQDFAASMKRINAGELGSADLFGTREFLKNNYLYRFLGAKLGIYGNSREEAVYPPYFIDADRNKLDASKHRYVLRFEKGQLPPAGAFWSITMYDGQTQLLVANPLKRYLLSSTMLDSFKFGEDGSLTLYVQKDSPGADKESNWLPAPDGPFYSIMRIYMPKPKVLNGTWKQPLMRKVHGRATPTSRGPVEYGRDGVVKNGTVDTRIGELTFVNGFPSRESVEDLFDAMDFQRATQARGLADKRGWLCRSLLRTNSS